MLHCIAPRTMAGSPALLLLLSLGLCEYGRGLMGHLCQEKGGQWVKAFPSHHSQETGQNGPQGKKRAKQKDGIQGCSETAQGRGSGGTAAQYAEPVQTGVAGGDGARERGGMRQLLVREQVGRAHV